MVYNAHAKLPPLRSDPNPAMPPRAPMTLFAGTAHRDLAESVAQHLGVPLGDLKITRFPDTEIYIKFEESVRGTDAFILQPTCAPIDQNLLELLILIDALRRASARSITCVLPYYGYARQEKKDRPREPITAKLIANLITTAGADRIVAMDLHADAIQGFFDIPVDHLTSVNVIADYFVEKKLENVAVVSPDEGRVKKLRRFANKLNAPLAVGYKFHPEHGVSAVSGLAGDVRGKTCIIYDDIISTGGSINAIVDTLLEHGALPEIYVACTHAVLAGPAMQRLSRPEIAELIVTDTIPVSEDKRIGKLKVISVAYLFAEALRRVWTGDSVSSLFD